MLKTYALFDFDGTLIHGDSIVLLCLYARRKGWLDRKGLLKAVGTAFLYGVKLCTPVRAKESALAFLAGRPWAEVDAIARSFCEEVLLPRFRPEGLATIAKHRQAGDTVLLISASSDFYLRHLQEALGVDDVIGTRFDVDARGVFTGRVCGDNCRGVQKALRLAEYLAAKGDRLDYEPSAAYGDSLGDLPMLRLCGRKVGVNPRPRLWRRLRHLPGAARVRWHEPGASPAPLRG